MHSHLLNFSNTTGKSQKQRGVLLPSCIKCISIYQQGRIDSKKTPPNNPKKTKNLQYYPLPSKPFPTSPKILQSSWWSGRLKQRKKYNLVSLNPNHSSAFLAKDAEEQLRRNTISIRSLCLKLCKATMHDQRLSCKTQECPISLLFSLRRIIPLTTDCTHASNMISIEIHPEPQT